jgi:hypothetical protein
VDILIIDKVDFTPKLVQRDKGHSILKKGTVDQEETTIVNLYVPNISVPNFLKQILLDLKAQIDPNIMIMGQ